MAKKQTSVEKYLNNAVKMYVFANENKLSYSQLNIVLYLGANNHVLPEDGTYIADLTTRLKLCQSSISESLMPLEERLIVERTRGIKDKRCTYIRLTMDGHELYQRAETSLKRPITYKR